MAELADALVLGSSVYDVQVQVLLSALVRVVIQHFLKTIVVQFVFEVIG